MLDGIYYAYATALFLLCVGYVAGYIVGRLDLIWRACSIFQKEERRLFSSLDVVKKPKRQRQQTKRARRNFNDDDDVRSPAPIEIDERKYVSAIKTDDLVKNEKTAIGKTTTTNDDIGASVSKLAQLKGK